MRTHDNNEDGQSPQAMLQQGSVDGFKAERKIRGLQWLVVVLSVLSSTFLYALDNTVTATVRPSMITTFGNQVNMLPWLSVSYPMGEFNNKTVYLAAILIFEVGSAVIGSAQTVQAAIIGRAIAGFGGSGIYVGTMTIISAMTLEIERASYLNNVGMAWALGTLLGPVIGGAFADSQATWRWAFYINLCIAALAAPACIFLIPSCPAPTTAPRWDRIKRIDYVGATLFLGGVIAVVMILGFGGAIWDWRSGQMAGLYAAAAAIWLLFCVQQRWSLLALERVFPVQLVGRLDMVIFFCWGALAISNMVVTIYSLPLFFQFVYGDSGLRSAAYTIPFIAAAFGSTGGAGPLFGKYPMYMPWFAACSALMLIGNGLLSSIDYHTSRGTICAFTVIQGLGCGPVIQLGYTAAQVKVSRTDKDDIRSVTAFMSCSQMAGLALSLGVATTVFLNSATADIAAIIPGVPREVIQDTINGLDTSLVGDLTAEARTHVLEAIANNVAKTFYLNVAGAAFGFILSLAMKRERLELESSTKSKSEVSH
ncbi:hypothetical protein KVR01_011946 [Diaporthe batatas]|uniref:uncharacterized protein n=1 Tax=Diaporthe batatas TaxID=748121 RepID=UPI001D051488|nr:uncharacterized protein KVR01_011946 [Diaporthe batatas]KAG8158185.1 hypothetical protein KVR01_011946 [Diaporthe batatas]